MPDPLPDPISSNPHPDATLKTGNGDRLSVSDGRKPMSASSISYHRNKKKVTFGIPLSVLQFPDHLFIAFHVSGKGQARGFGSWRMFKLKEGHPNE